jgi:hypothetical protein
MAMMAGKALALSSDRHVVSQHTEATKTTTKSIAAADGRTATRLAGLLSVHSEIVS